MANTHPFDDAVDEITAWLTDEPAYYAEALRAGHDAPFGASVTEEQKRQYYERQVFTTNPDGTPNYDQPNTPGRDMLIQRVGIPGYTRIMSELLPGARSRRGLPDVESSEEGGY